MISFSQAILKRDSALSNNKTYEKIVLHRFMRLLQGADLNKKSIFNYYRFNCGSNSSCNNDF